MFILGHADICRGRALQGHQQVPRAQPRGFGQEPAGGSQLGSSVPEQCQKMYEEQVLWAKEAGVDFIVAETINWVEEMKIALK